MPESALRAASVASQVSGGSRQLSQLPQGSEALAEIGEQRLAAAAGHLGEPDQGVELLALETCLKTSEPSDCAIHWRCWMTS